MVKEENINMLESDPHPGEGGYFRRTYESHQRINDDNKNRKLLTTPSLILAGRLAELIKP